MLIDLFRAKHYSLFHSRGCVIRSLTRNRLMSVRREFESENRLMCFLKLETFPIKLFVICNRLKLNGY